MNAARITLLALLSFLVAVSNGAEDCEVHPITIRNPTVGEAWVGGESLTLRGREQFDTSRLPGLRFRIGTYEVLPDIIRVDEVVLMIPREITAGTHPVQVFRHDESAGNDVLCFEENI